MSLPGIFRRLFGNEGAGPKLLPEIIPPHADTHGEQGSDPITPESIGALPASASGGAASADVAVKLKSSRTIDGMGFDGTKNIIHYAVCSTAAATAAKTVNLTGFVLEIGARILVRFDTTNTAVSPTLNVNGTGAKAIRYKNATVAASVLAAKATREFVYDGAYWQIVGDLDSNTTYGVFTKATATAAGKAGLVPAPGAGKQSAFLRGDGGWADVGGVIPIGGIILWSGAEASIPTGWALCNGQNGTPDLRDRMIMGAGTTYKTGSKGGAATHAHSVSGTVGATTLSAAQIGNHYHKIICSMSDNTNPKNYRLYANAAFGAPDDNLKPENKAYGIKPFTSMISDWSSASGTTSTSHAHSLTAKSGSASSLPPYYALAYIMRVA